MKNLKSMLIVGLSMMILILTTAMQTRKTAEAYEAACHMSDLIRCYKDHLHTDSLIEDYGLFDELEQVFLHEDGDVNLEEYVWCY